MDSPPKTPSVMMLSLLGSTEYKTSRTNIFQLPGESIKFFYEPIVFINPTSVRRVFSRRENAQHQVRFVVQMWDKAVESRVVEWLKSYLGEEAKKIIAQLIPYDEVRLVQKQTAEESTFRVSCHPTTYHQLKDSLAFYLYCNSKEEAEQLVDDIKADPESWMDQNLELECSGSSFQKSSLQGSNGLTPDGSLSSPKVQQRLCLNVVEDDANEGGSEGQKDKNLEKQIEDLKSDAKNFRNLFKRYVLTTKKYLFFAQRDTDYEVGPKGYITYQEEKPVDPSLKSTYGRFDISSGIFKAARNGTYLFSFNGRAYCTAEEVVVSLNVNNQPIHRAATIRLPPWEVPMHLKELVTLEKGDEVRMVITKGKLNFFEGLKEGIAVGPYATTFSGYFVAL